MTVKIYYIPNIQHLTYYEEETSIRVENNPMNRFDTVIFKGNNNTIDFSIRNRDRKAINLLDKTMTIHFTNSETGELVLTKTLEKLDIAKGYARVTVSEEEVYEWATGFYNYSVSVVEDNGREAYGFVDQVQNISGQLELRGGLVSSSTSVIEVGTFLSTLIGGEVTWQSGAVVYGNGTVHTAAFYLTNFIGEIDIQVTLNSSIPTNENDWATYDTFDTLSLTSAGLSCIKYFNVIGIYTFVRFVYRPHEFNLGTVDKVLYN